MTAGRSIYSFRPGASDVAGAEALGLGPAGAVSALRGLLGGKGEMVKPFEPSPVICTGAEE